MQWRYTLLKQLLLLLLVLLQLEAVPCLQRLVVTSWKKGKHNRLAEQSVCTTPLWHTSVMAFHKLVIQPNQ